MPELITFTINAVLWFIFILMFHRDRSRYRNCLVLFVALVVTLFSLLMIAGAETAVTAIFIIYLVLFLVPVFLVWNGIVMIKREGSSNMNLLSLVLGIIIGVGEMATFVWVLYLARMYNSYTPTQQEKGLLVAAYVISVTVIYASLSFLIFMIYSVFLMLIPHKRDFDYVIIHGAGLADGERVTKLLADRVDKAIKIYRNDPTPPYLIPSGGQGSDEKISEAEAMKRYLLEKGVPEEHIILEDKSTNTYENLVNSKEIIESREGRKYTALVTSNYHVYRALRHCRKIGLVCTGIGSHVAFYYWPSALIREYIAVHAEKKHALIFAAGWLMFMLPVLLLIK